MASMNYKIYILIISIVIGGCSSSEPEHEYSFGICSTFTFGEPIYDASVKLLEFYPTTSDSTITPPEFTINRDSLESLVFYHPIAIQAGVEGFVEAELLVTEKGYPSNIEITRRMYTIAEYAVNNVLHMAKFHPAKKNGVAIQCKMKAVFEFSRGEIIGYEERR